MLLFSRLNSSATMEDGKKEGAKLFLEHLKCVFCSWVWQHCIIHLTGIWCLSNINRIVKEKMWICHLDFSFLLGSFRVPNRLQDRLFLKKSTKVESQKKKFLFWKREIRFLKCTKNVTRIENYDLCWDLFNLYVT